MNYTIMNTQKEKKELELNKNYGFVFGLEKDENQFMIYNGDDNWTAINNDQKMNKKCKKTSSSVLEYINR